MEGALLRAVTIGEGGEVGCLIGQDGLFEGGRQQSHIGGKLRAPGGSNQLIREVQAGLCVRGELTVPIQPCFCWSKDLQAGTSLYQSFNNLPLCHTVLHDSLYLSFTGYVFGNYQTVLHGRSSVQCRLWRHTLANLDVAREPTS